MIGDQVFIWYGLINKYYHVTYSICVIGSYYDNYKFWFHIFMHENNSDVIGFILKYEIIKMWTQNIYDI